MDQIDKKLDRIIAEVTEVKITQAVHTAQMEEHMRRTHLLETRLENEVGSIKKDIEPIKAHVSRLNGMWLVIVGISVVLGILATILNIG